MTTLREKLVKIGTKVMSHGRYVTFQSCQSDGTHSISHYPGLNLTSCAAS